MKRYLLAIASVALLAPQLASAQQGYDPNTDRRGGYQGGYDNRPYDSNRGDYRQLFSCVFADFHLFDRLYGLRDADPAAVNRMIADMELESKTAYVDGRFTHLDLSTGQRKRLALIVALLEDRPIYVLDEVGADQDPVFRERFYREILPALRKARKAIIVISHDDRYFDLGDRLLTMRDGRLAGSGATA